MRVVSGVGILRHLSVLVVAVAGFLVAPGCRRHATDTDVVVSVDETEIHYPEFEAYLHDNVDSSDLPLEETVLDQLFDQFVDERLLIRLAVDRGLASESQDASPATAGPRTDRRAALRYLLRQASPGAIPQAELQAYYQAHREQYRRSASVRLNQILVHRREDAEAALEALEGGESFEEAAARFSQVPMANLGDSGGRLTRDDLPAAFADSIFELEPGEISEIFDADYGFHIFQVVELFPAKEVPFDEVAGEIRQRLERRRLDELAGSFLEEARRRYNVRTYLNNFPFDYRGFYAQANSD